MNKGPGIITTTSRRLVLPLSLRLEDIDINDIAISLARTVRFRGHGDYAISVAEHCVNLSYQVHTSLALAALLHDAAEAYLCDMPGPIKKRFGIMEDGVFVTFDYLEGRILDLVGERFGVSSDQFDAIHDADKAMGAVEYGMLFEGKDRPALFGKSATFARTLFMDRFNELTKADRHEP